MIQEKMEMIKRAEKRPAPVITLHQFWSRKDDSTKAEGMLPDNVCVSAPGAPQKSTCDRNKVSTAPQQPLRDNTNGLKPGVKMPEEFPKAGVSCVQPQLDKCIPSRVDKSVPSRMENDISSVPEKTMDKCETQVLPQTQDKCVPVVAPQATDRYAPTVAPQATDKCVAPHTMKKCVSVVPLKHGGECVPVSSQAMGKCVPVSSQAMGKCVLEGDFPLICFDLETTGLSIDDEIVQISACAVIDGIHQEFNQYVLPAKKMAFGASKVTGIRLRRGCLYHNRTKVPTCSILQALNKFIHWLKRFPKSLLVAHNAQFDSRMLIKGCVKYKLMDFGLKKAIAGFVDTISVVKEVFPGRACYQLEAVVKDELGKRFKAHDAREDTNALLLLIGHKSIHRHMLLKHSYSVEQAEKSYLALDEKKRNMKSLQELVDASALSRGMAEKVAESGLTKADLTSVVKSKGLEGLKEVFQADLNGKPRVTSRTAIVETLFEHLSLSDR